MTNKYIGKYCRRCKSNTRKNDNKINLRSESFFEGMRIPLNILYFLIYNCFLNLYSINSTYQEMLKFSEFIKINNITQNLIIKIFRQIRQKKSILSLFMVHNLVRLRTSRRWKGKNRDRWEQNYWKRKFCYFVVRPYW